MGLSSAQARLLTITARKSDCEFQSMSLSHQKLELSRDMESITDEYQNALNATKLVYDFYGTGSSEMALNYSLLMSPSVYNDYYPKFVTDATNRVVLNSALANAARACGIPQEGFSGTSSSTMRDAFIQALAQEGILSAAEVQSIENVPYDNAIGLGNETATEQSIQSITYDELIKQLESSSTNDMKDYGLYLGDFYTLYSNGEDNWKLLSARNKGKYNDYNYNDQDAQGKSPWSADGKNVNTGVYATNKANDGGKGKATDKYGAITTTNRDNDAMYFSNTDAASIKFTDLLSNDTQYTFTIDSLNGVVTDAAYMQILLCGGDDTKSMLNWMSDQLISVLGDTTANQEALAYAQSCILDIIWPDNQIQDIASSLAAENEDGESKITKQSVVHKYDEYVKNISANGAYNNDFLKSGSDFNDLINNAENYVGFYTRTGSGISVNLNNIAQVFMTAFVDYVQGMDNTNYSYGPNKKDNCVLYNPKVDTDVEFQQLVGYTADTGADKTTASFYDAMFNILCTQGWSENSRVDDADYMQEMLKNGLLYMCTAGEDGYYHTENYSTDKYVKEVADTDAIARAEAKYHSEKAKVESKEDSLDLKMKNLDTEISSLTQEYDSVKSLVSKSIEKSFQRYDA